MNQDTAQRVDSKYLGIFLATNTSEGDAWNNYSHYLKTLNLVLLILIYQVLMLTDEI
jgi:hypothetical protein